MPCYEAMLALLLIIFDPTILGAYFPVVVLLFYYCNRYCDCNIEIRVTRTKETRSQELQILKRQELQDEKVDLLLLI
jgi:hypothetical protein